VHHDPGGPRLAPSREGGGGERSRLRGGFIAPSSSFFPPPSSPSGRGYSSPRESKLREVSLSTRRNTTRPLKQGHPSPFLRVTHLTAGISDNSKPIAYPFNGVPFRLSFSLSPSLSKYSLTGLFLGGGGWDKREAVGDWRHTFLISDLST